MSFFFFFFVSFGKSLRLGKIRNRPDPVTFYDFIFRQIPHDKKHMYCLCHDTAFQFVDVVPDQPLHRWLVNSSFYVCRIVSPKFQQGILKYINP